jgi:hypothetical protein
LNILRAETSRPDPKKNRPWSKESSVLNHTCICRKNKTPTASRILRIYIVLRGPSMPIAAFVKQVYVLPFFPSFLTLCPVLDAKNVREKALREKKCNGQK